MVLLFELRVTLSYLFISSALELIFSLMSSLVQELEKEGKRERDF